MAVFIKISHDLNKTVLIERDLVLSWLEIDRIEIQAASTMADWKVENWKVH